MATGREAECTPSASEGSPADAFAFGYWHMAKAPIIPTMRYEDATAALDWLCQAFGFSVHQKFADDSGKIMHAELGYGGSVLMIGPVTDNDFGKYMKTPGMVGGVITQCVYIVVDDPDAHYATAKAAGAEILIDIQDQFYGGRDYTCRDPQGHIWSFGSYDPWKAAAAST